MYNKVCIYTNPLLSLFEKQNIELVHPNLWCRNFKAYTASTNESFIKPLLKDKV